MGDLGMEAGCCTVGNTAGDLDAGPRDLSHGRGGTSIMPREQFAVQSECYEKIRPLEVIRLVAVIYPQEQNDRQR